MEVIRLKPKKPNFEAIKRASDIIQKGGCVVFPTDTVYGLAVNALRKDATWRLFKIKKRPETKPVPIMVKDIEMAKKIAFIDKKTEKVLEKIWPGSVTAILQKRKIIPDILTANKNTVGLRIPACQIAKDLLNALDIPITGTSANFSGEPAISKSEEIIKIFHKTHPQPDLFLEAGDLPPTPPSTVLDLTAPQPKILRVGPVSKKELFKILSL